MQARIEAVKAAYEDLVDQLAEMDAELKRVMAQEAAKRVELASAAPSSPIGSAARTTPTGRRRSRRSCPVARSRTCSPR